MFPHIDLSKIKNKKVVDLKFNNGAADIYFSDGSKININYDMYDGLEYDYRTPDKEWFVIDTSK